MKKIEYNVYFRDNENQEWNEYAIYCLEKEMNKEFEKATKKHSEVKVVQRKIIENEKDIIIWRNGHYKLNKLN